MTTYSIFFVHSGTKSHETRGSDVVCLPFDLPKVK